MLEKCRNKNNQSLWQSFNISSTEGGKNNSSQLKVKVTKSILEIGKKCYKKTQLLLCFWSDGQRRDF